MKSLGLNLFKLNRRSYLKKCANLRRRYGITLDQRDMMILAQDWKCLICSSYLGDIEDKQVHVDHNHSSGNVRGVLCHHCNTGLGSFKDEVNTMEKAKKYIQQKWRELDRSKLYYLASPYSHENVFVEIVRYESVLYAGSQMTKAGIRLIEPITQSHQQSQRYDIDGGYKFWKDRDRLFIDKCDAIIVLTLKGWKESEGVTDEIQYAKSQGKEVILIDPIEFNIDWKEIH